MNLQTYLFRRVSYWTGLCSLIVLFTAAVRGDDPLPELVEFNRDIRPILSDACFHCHGPDQAKRQADLRLDREESALASHDGRRPLVPRDLQASVLYQRITSTDADLQMPPPDSGHTLTRRQIELIRKWIEQGVVWQKHWSFLPPRRPEVPTVQHANAVRNPIDAFVLAQLERKGLKPSEEADRNTLLRRVTLDLTGLPPTPDEVDAFLADNSPQAYETVVDRLLQSPRYGERMAMRWLDAARYADTSGYQTDGERTMWRWRDWVIAAYNDNMPFDLFTIEQLAGDLLPQPTMEQRIATAFNRNHRGNAEGGIIPEEYAVEYVVDRVETTWTVWLGLTMGCARCHDHKFDPLSQRDFYQQFAFFNNVPEQGRAVKYGNSPPLIKSPTLDEQAHLHAVDARLADAQKRWNELATSLTATQFAWEAATIPDSIRQGQRLTGMTSRQASFPVAPSRFKFAQHGESGAWMSELLPHLSSVADEMCIVKSMHTEAINHDPAITFFQTGAQLAGRPSIGSWLSYGLGSENNNLPAFVAMVSQVAGHNGGQPLYDRLWGSGFLPSKFQGIKFRSNGDPVLFLSNPEGLDSATRRRMLDDLSLLNQLKQEEQGDPEIATRIAQYELAYRMQTSVPELTDVSGETKDTFEMYGPNSQKPGTFAANCLLARRLAERGVRFIQLFHRDWDHHVNLPKGLTMQTGETDQTSAALLKDLKQRGMLDDTLVIWGGEFGRTVYCQGKLTAEDYGRDHHPRCFSIWLAGGGIKPGMTYGETDDYCYNVVQNPLHVHDLHATLLHCLGIDHTRMTYKFQGRRYRLTDVHGNVVQALLR